MYQFSRSGPATPAKQHLLVFITTIIFGYMSAFVFFAQMWADSNYLLHSVIEIISISLLFSTFTHIWNTYKETNHFIQWVGFGSLIMVLLNLPFVVNPADFINMSEKAANFIIDIPLKYGVLVAYLEIIIWLVLGIYRKDCAVSKWTGMALSLCTVALVLAALIMSVNYIPEFYNELNFTILKYYADFLLPLIAIVVLLVYLAKSRNAIDYREKTIYEYIILALCFFIAARISFALSREAKDPINFLAHIFRASYYFSIYYGIYKTTIEYPYKQVRILKEFYENLLDSSPMGLITFDLMGKVSYANLQCNSLFGYDLRKLYGASAEQLLNSVLLYDYSKSELLGKLQKLQEGTITFHGMSTFASDSASKLFFTVLRLETGIVFVIKDAKKTQAMEYMQLQTQTLLNSMDTFVFILDINAKVVMCNKKFLEVTNIKTDDAVGLDLMELSRFIKSNLKDCVHIDKINKEIMQKTTWCIQTLKGDLIKIKLDISPIYDVDYEKIGWIVIGRDISEYEKEQEKIIHNEKMAVIGQMAAGLVHEIKNPLASIKGLCQLMVSRAKPEKISEYAAVMEKAVDDIFEIVTGFLQFSKPTNGNFELAYINSLVSSLEMMISTNAYKHGIKTWFYYCDTEEAVIMSSQQIKNVILGMVDNALDAMNAAIDPKLIISTEYDRNINIMRISVKDNGIGMTEEQLASIGTPFYTTKARGTGLGVSVIKHIVNEHKGTLKIESKFGEGTVFTISLPCKAVN